MTLLLMEKQCPRPRGGKRGGQRWYVSVAAQNTGLKSHLTHVQHVASQATTDEHVSDGNLPWYDKELQRFGHKRRRNGSKNRMEANKPRDRLSPLEEEEDDLGEIILLDNKGLSVNVDVSTRMIVISSSHNIFVF
jgi:hypothetical protein